MGIAEETLPHVFDLFVQERQAIDRAQGGLGLGLAIVRSLVTMHGGTVSVTSGGRGAGSVFIIRLPLVTRPVGQVTEAPEVPRPLATIVGAPKVLIVDDNVDAADTLALVLKQIGCETRVAYDGPSALALAETFWPALALLDIGLPGMDGYELARRLRERPDAGHIRLVAVTGYARKSDGELARGAGFDEHLVKPVELDELVALLANLARAD
jgi:CheY-like chemotaxis protein